MSSQQEEILSFEIVIDAKLSEETKKTIEELKGAKEGGETSASADASELLKSEGELTQAQIDQIKTSVAEVFDTGAEGIEKLAGFAKNPQGMMKGVMTKLIGAGAMAGPLAIAIAAPIVTIEIIKILSVKGGALNRDWRRFIENEVAVGLSRQQQLEDRFGVSQTILTQIHGFAPNNENWTYNSLFDVNDQRIARIGMSDREAGVTMFIP